MRDSQQELRLRLLTEHPHYWHLPPSNDYRSTDILALALLFEYIPSEIARPFAKNAIRRSSQQIDFGDNPDPGKYLERFLIKLHEQGGEINVQLQGRAELFEEYLILLRQYTQDPQVKAFLQLALSADNKAMRQQIVDLKKARYWNVSNSQFAELLKKDNLLDFYEGFLQLHEFFFKLCIFLLEKVKNDLLISAICHFHRSLWMEWRKLSYYESTFADLSAFMLEHRIGIHQNFHNQFPTESIPDIKDALFSQETYLVGLKTRKDWLMDRERYQALNNLLDDDQDLVMVGTDGVLDSYAERPLNMAKLRTLLRQHPRI